MKYRVTFNSGYQKVRFEFHETEYDEMTKFINTAMMHRVNGKDRYSDDDSDDMRKIEIEYVTEEDGKNGENTETEG